MEESSQLENLISKEINSMSMQDLKNKVIKLAQAYRSERIRNDYFEKSLKSTNIELAKNKKISNMKYINYTPLYFRTSYNSIYNPNESNIPY